MKPGNVLDIERKSSMQGETIDMSFDENSLAHIMSVLTDLYSNPELAVIREYSTNALDAHIEAGNDGPIEITTPSWESFFKVKDYGVGMNRDDIINIYSKYGASTKRGTDTQVGMLGLGCKSALTYMSQFNVIGIKDGIKTNIVIGRNDNGAGSCEIISATPTDEPNGVEVIIPTRAGNSFKNTAQTFFSFWRPGSVLIDGKPVDNPYMKEEHRIVEDIYFVGNENSYIVMGNVAYPVDRLHFNMPGVVAYVNIGSVDFTPSRESLHYTKKTIATCNDIIKKVQDGLASKIASEVAGAPDLLSANRMFAKWIEKFSYYYNSASWIPNSIDYKGEELNRHSMYAWKDLFECDYSKDQYIFFMYNWSKSYNHTTEHHYDFFVEDYYDRNKINLLNWLSASSISRTIFIQNYSNKVSKNIKPDSLPASHRKKVLAWIDKKYPGVRVRTVFLPTTVQHEIFDDRTEFEVLEWADIKDIKYPKAVTDALVRPKTIPKYSYYINGNFNNVLANEDLLSISKDIYYCDAVSNSGYRGKEIAVSLTTIVKGAIVVVLTENRKEKFKRIYPTAKSIYDMKDTILNSVDKDILDAISLQSNGLYGLDYLRDLTLDDPELAYFVDLKQRIAAVSNNVISQMIKALNMFDMTIPNTSFEGNPDAWNKYPMYHTALRSPKEHLEWYLNSYYRELIKGEKNVNSV